MGSLRRILGVTWRDKIPNIVILQRTGCTSLESLLHRGLLRWVGHVIRMDDNRLPKQLLYGELSEGIRSVGGQLKRYKDHVKKTLRACHIQPTAIETLAADRTEWRASTKKGIDRFEEDRNQWLCARRDKRHRAAETVQDDRQSFVCPEPGCGRSCASRVGLGSHMRAHQRRRAEQTVIVGHDGPP